MWLSETWILFAVTFVAASNVTDVSYSRAVCVRACPCVLCILIIHPYNNYYTVMALLFTGRYFHEFHKRVAFRENIIVNSYARVALL